MKSQFNESARSFDPDNRPQFTDPDPGRWGGGGGGRGLNSMLSV